ncbi:carbohydrate esterase family 4 protein [Collybia nuda]|uniref:Carbohydrate esterase family 4 protein n=1 Tax=Collybia nuda TaxID=64659 RepID=A0A9P5Y5W9_9AGAR|nr:carbohydrate esterase family 4 protein [Collybia nuda]
MLAWSLLDSSSHSFFFTVLTLPIPMHISALLPFALAAVVAAHPFLKELKAQVITKCSLPNTAALTFDDGPYIYMRNVSDALTKEGVKGTFFLNGNNYRCIYGEEPAKDIKYVYDQGHQIASHTWAHAHLNNLTRERLNEEFQRVELAFQRITGATPAFMRPPYGEYNNTVLEVAGERGQNVVTWDFDSRDSVGATAEESNRLYDELAKAHPATVLALNHDVYKDTAHTVVPYAIAVLKKAGYKLVTVAECVGQKPYQKVDKPSPRDKSWAC